MSYVTIYDRRPESANEEQARLIERLIKAGVIKNKGQFFSR